MEPGRTAVVETRTDLLEAVRDLYPGRSDCDILEGLARDYLLRRNFRDAQACSGLSEERIAYEEPIAVRHDPNAGPEHADEMREALAAAPADDEESTDEEDRSTAKAIAEYRDGKAASADQVRRELGSRSRSGGRRAQPQTAG